MRGRVCRQRQAEGGRVGHDRETSQRNSEFYKGKVKCGGEGIRNGGCRFQGVSKDRETAIGPNAGLNLQGVTCGCGGVGGVGYGEWACRSREGEE